jgi:hypothetical protein
MYLGSRSPETRDPCSRARTPQHRPRQGFPDASVHPFIYAPVGYMRAHIGHLTYPGSRWLRFPAMHSKSWGASGPTCLAGAQGHFSMFSGFGGLGSDRKLTMFGVWAAPACWKIHPIGVPLHGPAVGGIFRPAGAAQTSTLDDFRSVAMSAQAILLVPLRSPRPRGVLSLAPCSKENDSSSPLGRDDVRSRPNRSRPARSPLASRAVPSTLR